MSNDEVKTGLEEMLEKFPHIKGVNNHTGSKFTENREKMDAVMEVLKRRGLFFLDSKTTNKSKASDAAKNFDVAYAGRNIFLDNKNELDYILKQLALVEKIAAKNGYAIAIGHPKSETYNALRKWLPDLEDRGFRLVHLSALVDFLQK